MLKTSLAILLILTVFNLMRCQSPSSSPDAVETTQPPNVIYIMADDLGYGDLGCYGQAIIRTPHLDQMAAEGMRFTQHYAGNTVCAPSRAALMTGQHMGHAEVRGNGQVEPAGQTPLSDSAVTVAEILQNAGYTTALIGKWGLGNADTSGDPLKQGFDSYYGYLDQVLAHNYYPEYLLRDGEKEMLTNEVQYLDTSAWHRGLGSYAIRKEDYSHDLFTQEALRFIEQPRDKPFFLYLPYTIPHNNGEAPPNEKQEVPDFGPYAEQDWPKESKGYAAMITRLDRDVGQLLDKLRETGLDSTTLVIFTSDNGPMPDEEFTERFNSNGSLRGGKRDLYEGGVRVPLIARWPGRIAANTISDHVSAFWDFLPTAAELAEVTPPERTDGISYLPTLLGKPNAQAKHDYLYWEFPAQGYKIGLRRGKWKAVRNDVQTDPDSPLELYNLEEDRGEENNVADQHPKVVQKLRQLMGEAHVPSSRFPMPGVAESTRR